MSDNNDQFVQVPVPPVPTVYTVSEAMAECGVNNVDLFEGKTQAERLASDLFSDDFHTCMDKTHGELDSDFKTYSDLTQTQGQIRITPGIKKNIKAFLQWSRDEYRLGRNPEYGSFSIVETQRFIRRYKTHKQFMDKSSDVSDAAKPSKFTTKMRWSDWAPTFLNYLRTIPGRDGVPLSYVCRDSDQPDPTPHEDFIDDYVTMAPINHGEAFGIDASEVHTLIVKFITGNDTAEMKIKAHELLRNGRTDWTSLKEHYEGIGIHAFDIHEAETILQDLYYSGEKQPHMFWERFEQRLTYAFTTYAKVEGPDVYTQNMKLRTLLHKIKADFLVPTKAGLNIELTKRPMTMTYDRALAIFRNEVNNKNPPQLSTNLSSRERRSMREVNTQDSRGRGRGRGRGRHNGGRGRGNWVTKTRSDSTIITLTDGQNIEYHPSFSFPSQVFLKMKQADKERLKRERAEYKKRKASEISTNAPFSQVNTDHSTQISQLSQGTNPNNNAASYPPGSTIMGGRNERSNTRN